MFFTFGVFVTASVLSSHRGRAVTVKERDVVRGTDKWKGRVAGLLD